MSTVAIFDDAIFDDAIFDTRIKSHFVTIDDEGGNVSDFLTKQSKFNRILLEGEAAMFDSAIFDDAIFDTDGGGGQVVDSVIASKSNPIIISEAAIVVSDLLERLLNARTSIVETVTTNDSVARVAKYFRSLTEVGGGMFDGSIFDSAIFDVQFGAITISDSVSTARGAVVSFSENVPNTEDLQRMLKSFRSLVDTTIISGLVNAKKSAFRLLADTVTNGESITSKLKAFRVFTEPSIVVSDMIASGRGAIISFVETTVISELLTRLTNQYRTFTEAAIVVSDSLSAFKVVGRRIKTAVAWINKRSTKAFILKRKTNAYANKRKTTARV